MNACVCVFTCVHNNKEACVCCLVLEAEAAVMLWLLSLKNDSPDTAAPSIHTPIRHKRILIKTFLNKCLCAFCDTNSHTTGTAAFVEY